MTTRRIFFVGDRAEVRTQLESVLGVSCTPGLPDHATRHDYVFLQVAGFPPELPGGNAFTACRHLKVQGTPQVFLLVEEGDAFTPEIARFCLADGALEVGATGLVASYESVRERLLPRRRAAPVDALLAKLETEIGSDDGRRASALQRMLERASEPNLLDRLVDPETGLFDGPYTSFKLDEEFKRAMRFHQPLSVVLLDVGVDLTEHFAGDSTGAARQRFLAEVASVFLNECRDIDVIGRFTEETFLILMPGTGQSGAAVVVRRMLAGLESRGVFAEVPGRPAAGVATMPAPGIHDRRAFLARAEACLRVARDEVGCGGFCADSE